ncbi:MAG: ChbG/HpnK family deacetylase [Acidobacteriia bacterium]|nr:ChbG/HpnK family deacetylase [Terriglobia bacterium]MYC65406.1 ChbG/HpnK family deacetylase [Terriglobia bacterium]
MAVKRLVVNADDFGFTPDVNEGILRSHLEGIVRSTSLMANGPAFEHAVRIAHQHPSLGVGCHLTLVQGESVASPGTRLPRSAGRLLASPPTLREALRELQAQIEALLAHGVRPSHLDTHQHVHLLPVVLEAVVTLADRFRIPWIRKPFDTPLGMAPVLRAGLALAIRPWRIPFEERLRRARCRTSDYFAGFVGTGAMDARWLVALLTGLPGGTGELMCHPGICGPYLRRADTRLKQSREREMRALCSDEVRQAVAERGIELLSFRDLAADAAEAPNLARVPAGSDALDQMP